MGDLSEHFSKSEFACRCGCGFDTPNEKLLTLLEAVRTSLGKPMVINSGCRCENHNRKVGGKPNSSHLRGCAVDIKTVTGADAFLLVQLATKAGFRRLGVAKGFIHLDTDETLPNPALWQYGA